MARANGMRSTMVRRALKAASKFVGAEGGRLPAPRRRWSRSAAAAAATVLLLFAIPALASETITYTYDALGRLVKVDHGAAGPNAGVVSSYTYDKTHNRCNVTVATDGSTGVATCAGGTTTLTLSPTTLPSGTTGTAYSQTISASGGAGGYTYSITSGTLPAGLGLNSSTGVLSGTPTTAATYSFTITATDSAAAIGSRTYSLTINSSALTVSPTSLPNGTVGTAYSRTISATGGTAPYTYSRTAGTLPAGLTLNSSTGALSGTPTTAATYSFTIRATDSASHIGSRNYSVTIGGGVATCSGISFAATNTSTIAGTPLVFVVNRTGSTSTSCSVNYATADGTALSGEDYTPVSGTLTFSSTQTYRTVSVQTVENNRPSGPTFALNMYLNLSNPSGGATISTAQGIGSISGSGTGTTCLTCDASAESTTLDSAAPATEPSASDTSPSDGSTTPATDPPAESSSGDPGPSDQ